MATFSQMPTLGEFIEHACHHYGFVEIRIRIPGLGRIVYLRREKIGLDPEIVDLPPGPETQRLSRNDLRSLSRRTGVPREDFGVDPGG